MAAHDPSRRDHDRDFLPGVVRVSQAAPRLTGLGVHLHHPNAGRAESKKMYSRALYLIQEILTSTNGKMCKNVFILRYKIYIEMEKYNLALQDITFLIDKYKVKTENIIYDEMFIFFEKKQYARCKTLYDENTTLNSERIFKLYDKVKLELKIT